MLIIDSERQPQVEGDDYASASTNKVDNNRVDVEENAIQGNTKIDSRNFTDYTFIGTGEESFRNPLNRTPASCHISGQSAAAQIYVNIFKSTKQKIFATSSVAGIKARFIFA